MLGLLGVLVFVATPTLSNIWRAPTPMEAQRIGTKVGPALRTSLPTSETEQREPHGLRASLTLLARWHLGHTLPDDFAAAVANVEPETASIRTFFRGIGLHGAWLELPPSAMHRVRTPFMAPLPAPDLRFVIVRDVRQGYVYFTRLPEGNFVTSVQDFAARWSGRIFAFEAPPDPSHTE